MSSFAPRPVSKPHHFEVARTGRGYWVVNDKEGVIGGVFRTQKDAVRFALFEVDGDRTCVRVLSSGSILTGGEPVKELVSRPAISPRLRGGRSVSACARVPSGRRPR